MAEESYRGYWVRYSNTAGMFEIRQGGEVIDRTNTLDQAKAVVDDWQVAK